ncbi:alpha/beta hydrolase [Leifsonia sp. LS1]|uniref:alpha/beta fold hydrolase n=1 Tax=Leifsonia sp. LS1 TaxID=2828483 RepID=UPI001CFE3030|nr:alpha/beta fold hydrolase [Leifsonia sp. LS1]GIT81163.1 alpha/beta hydrolase [Leifsonia sp. LS1]
MVASEPTTRTALVLHGGGGPRTIAPIAEHLSGTMRVIAPTHPGWEGTPRPGRIDSVSELATHYLGQLRERGEHDVVLVGSSLGGWIALEMALRAAADARYAGVVGAVVDIDGVGAVVDGEPIADFFALDARGLAQAAWHDPDRGFIDPATLTEEQRALQRSNGQAMAAVAGTAMSDPTLLARLGAIAVPTLVVHGASDRIVTPAYGQAVADAIPGAAFAEVAAAGHLPHLEAPQATWSVIDPFLAAI